MGIAEKAVGALQNYVSQPQQPQQPQQQPYTNQWGSSQQAPQQVAPAWKDEDFLTGRDIRQVAPQMITDAVTPQFNTIYESLAQTNLDSVRRSNVAIFDKYGPEVYAYVAKLPVQSRTVDNLLTVVKLVKADHLDDLVSEGASRLAGEMTPTLRSNGSPSVPVASQEPKYTLQSDTIPQDWKDRAAKAGLTESAVDEFCRANDISREAFFSQFGTTAITEARR